MLHLDEICGFESAGTKDQKTEPLFAKNRGSTYME